MSGFLTSSTTTTTTDGYNGLTQTIFIELADDGYTISREPVFSTLLSENIITSGGNLVVSFSASFGANASISTVMFRVLLDDVVQRSVSTGFLSDQKTQSASIVFHKVITSDAHTIKVEWAKGIRDNRFSTLYILAETDPNIYHASLLIQEVE